MLKVSFRNDFKFVSREDRKTTVTLYGELNNRSEFWDILPESIFDELFDYSKLTIGKMADILRFEGHTIRHPNDKDNPVIAERIAESRAKIKLYKFMMHLCHGILRYYYDILYGNAEMFKVIEDANNKPKDCIYVAFKKYRNLLDREKKHLDKLIAES